MLVHLSECKYNKIFFPLYFYIYISISIYIYIFLCRNAIDFHTGILYWAAWLSYIILVFKVHSKLSNNCSPATGWRKLLGCHIFICLAKKETASPNGFRQLVFVYTANTNYHKLSGLNNGNLFLTDLETGKPKINVLADPCLGKACFMGRGRSSCILTGWRAEKEKALLCVSVGALIQFRRAHFSWSNISQY